ncbi:MAG: class I SAM-dependent methyltransferase [Chloroflexi bacterium]|nr:class I SAM-dependent methyltransferase [Chloroflexota bacterium]MDA1002178.1 class I SAM-dependent methyltransferase [Chloroflexota bacterium]
MDQESGFVDLARVKAERLRVSNVRWIAQRAEDLDVGAARFDLVCIGNAFHRLPRRVVAGRAYQWLTPTSCIALLWSGAPWAGQAQWQRTMAALVQRWIARAGAEDRIPAHLDATIEKTPHREVLIDAGFEVIGKFEFLTPHVWTIEALVGFAYSTSVLSREVLGARTPEFAEELRGELLALEPSNRFEQDISSAYDLARRPAMT